MSYGNAGDNIYKREIPESSTTKSESVNIKPEKNKKKYGSIIFLVGFEDTVESNAVSC